MLKGYKYRIYPNQDQQTLINKHIGACRFVYNLAHETKQMAFAGNKINLTCFDLHKQLTGLIKDVDWLSEIGVRALQQSIIDLDKAYTSFFKGTGGFPKFKKKSGNESFRVLDSISIDFEKGALKIPKFKTKISIVIDRKFAGSIKRVTISKTKTGKFFASVLVETGISLPIKQSINDKTTIGVDMGIKSFLTTSDGLKFDNPQHLRKSISKLKYLQRKFSKHKGKRTKKRLAILHEKVANQRKDFLHKTSSNLIKNQDSISIEDLAVSNMLKNHKLALSISDAGWGMFFDMLEYKAEWYGKNILKIGRFEPSSKLCSNCGKINKELSLKDREWTCSCGSVHDRDVNAAINIKNFSLKNIVSGDDTKNHGELPTLVGVMTHEALNGVSSPQERYLIP